jgi:MtN3 and saliva related transmembrane protein
VSIIVDLVGSVAATLTTFCFVPQVMRVLKTRDTKSISLAMYLVFVTGVLLWLVYGILLMNWVIILANIVTFGLAATILVAKLKWG